MVVGDGCGLGCGAGVGAEAEAEAEAGVAAAWLAEVSFCSSSAKRCIVCCSNEERSLLRRFCSSRSASYCASRRPAVPTHWSTGLTCIPGGITPMLVTLPGWSCRLAASVAWGGDEVSDRISQSRPIPPTRIKPSSPYWRWRGESRSTTLRRAWPARSRTGGMCPFMAAPPGGSRRPACVRPDAGCGARWRRRRRCRRHRPRGRTPARSAPWAHR